MAISQGIYLLQFKGGRAYYAGMTTNVDKRYTKTDRQNHMVAFVPVDNAADLRSVEKEAIEFCSAFGLPLTNTQHNPKRRIW